MNVLMPDQESLENEDRGEEVEGTSGDVSDLE
jgi:hypothetical protein